VRNNWPEEAVCFTCHSAAGPGTNVQASFTAVTNTTTRFFKHDIAATTGIHSPLENTATAFGGANRHIECEDCHSPHTATRGSAVPPNIQLVMKGATGVDPIWTAAGAPGGYNWQTSSTREYQVCFKCHSGYTTLPSYQPDGWNGTAYVTNGLRKLTNAAASQIQDSRNLAQEFNPNNNSFHPLAAVGQNQSIPAASFVNGWTQTSLVYCSSCHNTNAAPVGPHGAANVHILKGTANFSTVDNTNQTRPAAGEVCFQCHAYATYVNGGAASTTNFRNGTNNNYHTFHAPFGTCYTCHDSHGSEQKHMINFDAAAMTFNGGRNSQNAWVEVTTGNGGGSCYVSCHGKNHNPETYNR
jgi:predicted CXXCH cytochrome family protein